MPRLKTTKRRASTINMLPSNGNPNLGAATRLMVPVVLEALHGIDNEKNATTGEKPGKSGTPSSPNGVK
jgi:hypothetical protein